MEYKIIFSTKEPGSRTVVFTKTFSNVGEAFDWADKYKVTHDWVSDYKIKPIFERRSKRA